MSMRDVDHTDAQQLKVGREYLRTGHVGSFLALS